MAALSRDKEVSILCSLSLEGKEGGREGGREGGTFFQKNTTYLKDETKALLPQTCRVIYISSI